MKKSELRQLIKEEIKSILLEEDELKKRSHFLAKKARKMANELSIRLAKYVKE